MPRATWPRTSWPPASPATCQVQISYAIGVAKPTSIMATTFGTGKISDEKIEQLIAQHFDLRPKGIVQMLDLLRPIYRKTAAYGHFGRDEPAFTWEKTDKAAALAADAGSEGARRHDVFQSGIRRGALQRHEDARLGGSARRTNGAL